MIPRGNLTKSWIIRGIGEMFAGRSCPPRISQSHSTQRQQKTEDDERYVRRGDGAGLDTGSLHNRLRRHQHATDCSLVLPL